ncbi:MAG TPA: sialidase family protein [Chloroflexia bacterium]|nr:sialidase family protein [Chloroflexia bacterium]
MASSTTPTKDTEVQKEQETTVAAQSTKRKSNKNRLVTGLIALILIAGLAALAFLAATGNSGTVATPTANPGSTASAGVPTPSITAGVGTPAISISPRLVINTLAANPDNYQAIFAATSDGLRSSTDGGKTWNEVPDFKGQVVTALAVDQDNNAHPMYAGTGTAGLFKSEDSGKTWKNIGLVGRPVSGIAIAKGNLYVSVAGPRSTIYHSTDGGTTFSAPAANNLPATVDIRSIAVDSTNPQNVYIGTAYNNQGLTPDWDRVKFSDDGGKTWHKVGPWGPDKGDGPDATRTISLLLYARGDRLFAGDGDSLWRLTPDRSAWEPVANGLPANGIYGLTLDPQLPGLLYAATSDGFYRNSDGQSWQKLATGEASSIFNADANQQPLNIQPSVAAVVTGNAANSKSGLHSTYLYALTAEGRLVRYENRDFGTEVVAAVPGGSDVPDFSAYGGVNPADPLPPPEDGTNDPNKLYFKETGHYIQGDFKDVYLSKGQNALVWYGYPLTEEYKEYDPNTKVTKLVQYFERVKFEKVGDDGNVGLALIGYDAIEGKFYPPGHFVETNDSQRFFSETNHTLHGAFLEFWNSNGGLSRFGFPITDEFTEKRPDGKEVVYQYFQRAKFAFDPETKKVTIALLGREVLQKKHWIK